MLGHQAPQAPKDRLVFALDVDHFDEAERLVTALAPHVGMFKVGPVLFTGAGAQVIDLVHAAGCDLFLDLKFHDIPATVAGAAREVARRRVKMFTVHALGGPKMFRAITKEMGAMTLIPGSPPPMVLGVTVLTSHDADDLAAIGFGDRVAPLVQRLAGLAMDHGASGVVASGHEVAALRAVLPERTVFVVPGIRGPGDPVADQSRVMSAGDAVAAGATYVVVGRPIRQAPDPVEAAQRIVDDIARAHP